MENEAEKIAFLSLILGAVLFVFPIEYFGYSLLFLCFGVALAIIKKMWVMAGWASDKIEKFK